MGVVMVEQPLLVAGEAEEPVLLLHPLDRAPVDGAEAVDELGLGVVSLAGDAVEALVRVELDVAVVVDGLEKLLHGPGGALCGGAYAVGVGDLLAVAGRVFGGSAAHAPDRGWCLGLIRS